MSSAPCCREPYCTEQIFTTSLGFGKLIVDAVFNRDYAVVQGVVPATATTYIMLNLLCRRGPTCWSIRGCARDGLPRSHAPPDIAVADATEDETRCRAGLRPLRRRKGAMVGLAFIVVLFAAAGHLRRRSIVPYDPTLAHQPATVM